MKALKLYSKILKNFFLGKTVNITDISNSYNKVSNTYEKYFLSEMHKYNIEMLTVLIEKYTLSNKESFNILDLACGTGFNSTFINKNLTNSSFTLVDISWGMLSLAKQNCTFNCNFVESDMLSYLKNCKENSFDIIICAWAIKYQNPHKIIKECSRVLKAGGSFSVIVNLKNTLPEIRKVYPKLLKEHSNLVNKVMIELPNPLSEYTFEKWFVDEKFNRIKVQSGSHCHVFNNTFDLVNWVTSTGALAGFDTMLDLSNDEVKNTFSTLLNKYNLNQVTHKYVWGVFRNDK
ncbi:class I SAM-dependent methyltransferase [Clostridium carnis]